jgi:hypothetical protein
MGGGERAAGTGAVVDDHALAETGASAPPRTRAAMSEDPPGGKATTMRMGREDPCLGSGGLCEDEGEQSRQKLQSASDQGNPLESPEGEQGAGQPHRPRDTGRGRG